VVADPRLAEPGAPPGAALVITLVVPTVLAALAAIMITHWRGNGPIVDLRLKFGWRDVGIGVACGVTGVIVTIPAGMLWAVWVGEERAYSAVGKVFDGIRLNPWLAVLVFLIIWLLAPLCEEIIYRGVLWGAMERRSWNRWIILAIATVVFALAHGELLRTPLLLVVGLPMGVARMLSGRLPAAVIAHQINNFLPALVLMLLLLGVPVTDV
jgi:membrane protease YdiL (CAAX protease family)